MDRRPLDPAGKRPTVPIGAVKRIVDDTDVVFDGQGFPFVFTAEYEGHPPDRYLDGVLIKQGDRGGCVEARRKIFEKERLFRFANLGYEDARRSVFDKQVAPLSLIVTAAPPMASATRANAINNSDLRTRMMDMLTP
ncbi:MAG: hypothetical protein ACXWKQ_05995 [Reyranella sp.]